MMVSQRVKLAVGPWVMKVRPSGDRAIKPGCPLVLVMKGGGFSAGGFTKSHLRMVRSDPLDKAYLPSGVTSALPTMAVWPL